MFLEMSIRSKELGKTTQVNIIIPNNALASSEPVKTLWLLHGRSDDHTTWMRNTLIERYAEDHGIAVVMPNADKSWYSNTAYQMNYFNYITPELEKMGVIAPSK
jgi:S-formylglutathione hydrolase FrmB